MYMPHRSTPSPTALEVIFKNQPHSVTIKKDQLCQRNSFQGGWLVGWF